MAIDLLKALASDLQRLLSQGSIKSVDLIGLYLDQIGRHNHKGLKLNAIISVAPQQLLYEEARKLDAKRAVSGPRGPLHGIPIVVKVKKAVSFVKKILNLVGFYYYRPSTWDGHYLRHICHESCF
jgi:Asp-tRNA(Asn)/Glu-tRNA(Gln) amidotransferase A subunit family amidase